MQNSSTDARLIVVTSLPDRATAMELARALLEARLAACVNIGAPVESLYHWQAQIETASEIPLLIKTRRGRYDEIEAMIRARHPYELPEIVAVPVVEGAAAFLSWIAKETAES